MEPYRQLDYCELVKARIMVLLGEADRAAIHRALDLERSPLPGADRVKTAMRDVNMARRLYELGQNGDSVKFAERALLLAPVAQAYTVMGQSYARLGRCADAGVAFAQAVKLDPREARAVEAAKAACR